MTCDPMTSGPVRAGNMVDTTCSIGWQLIAEMAIGAVHS